MPTLQKNLMCSKISKYMSLISNASTRERWKIHPDRNGELTGLDDYLSAQGIRHSYAAVYAPH